MLVGGYGLDSTTIAVRIVTRLSRIYHVCIFGLFTNDDAGDDGGDGDDGGGHRWRQ